MHSDAFVLAIEMGAPLRIPRITGAVGIPLPLCEPFIVAGINKRKLALREWNFSGRIWVGHR